MSHIRGGLNLNADVQPCFFYSNLYAYDMVGVYYSTQDRGADV